jgi:hypothetical protein
MPSNAVIIFGARVPLPDAVRAAGGSAANYLDDGEPAFKAKARVRPLQHFVLHETCGNTASGCKDTLIRKGYGVQLILGPDGRLSCHGDLGAAVMVHANQVNPTSLGIEVVNPYAPAYARKPFGPTLQAQWWTWVPAGGVKAYVLPTPTQLMVLKALVPWLCGALGIPVAFPTAGLGPKLRKIPGWDRRPAAVPGPGVVAHRDFANHADGRYPLEFVMGRCG